MTRLLWCVTRILVDFADQVCSKQKPMNFTPLLYFHEHTHELSSVILCYLMHILKFCSGLHKPFHNKLFTITLILKF